LAYCTNIAIGITITSITSLVFVFARIAELKIIKKSNVRMKKKRGKQNKENEMVRQWLEKSQKLISALFKRSGTN
jgi:biopolymer transport protein ExbB/TolQ|tara:strand:+ start:149 stop:373 length:225 start_codon:yes stop_codon:yes gene_type:complete